MTLPTAVATTEFPFDLLHAEIVNYFRERDQTKQLAKAEWIERLKSTEGCEALMKDKTLANQILCHVSA